MKKEFKSLSWKVKNYDVNRDVIEDYDILDYREDFIKKLKKKCKTKEEFSKELHSEFLWQYWSRAEYELIIQLTDDGRVILLPWCGSRNPEDVAIDVTEDTSFDWKGFAAEHIRQQIFKNEAKIDVFDQVTYGDQFEKLVDYCWHTRLKYERKDPKFDK